LLLVLLTICFLQFSLLSGILLLLVLLTIWFFTILSSFRHSIVVSISERWKTTTHDTILKRSVNRAGYICWPQRPLKWLSKCILVHTIIYYTVQTEKNEKDWTCAVFYDCRKLIRSSVCLSLIENDYCPAHGITR
jgi:hypothetical protein